MPDAPIVSRPYHAKMACERCTFGSGEHAEWCDNAEPLSAFQRSVKAFHEHYAGVLRDQAQPPTASPWEDPWAKRKE